VLRLVEGPNRPNDPTATSRTDGTGGALVAEGIVVGEWQTRLELPDVASKHRSFWAARFLVTLVRDIGPILHGVYLSSRVRARAVKQERARIARLLHDGAIQSLIGAEMHIDALSKRAGAEPATRPAALELRKAQLILREEIVRLRELMVWMKPLDVGPSELPDYLSNVVNRFSADSGIRGYLVVEGTPPGPPHRCAELARIVQEALSNARKHSGATEVHVSLRASDEAVRLAIEDNGRGFPFDGTVTITDETPKSSTPESLRESVRALGGELVIQSTPGRGARLEVTVPTLPALAAASAARRVAS
jgi:signal transduction histidine kinase